MYDVVLLVRKRSEYRLPRRRVQVKPKHAVKRVGFRGAPGPDTPTVVRPGSVDKPTDFRGIFLRREESKQPEDSTIKNIYI